MYRILAIDNDENIDKPSAANDCILKSLRTTSMFFHPGNLPILANPDSDIFTRAIVLPFWLLQDQLFLKSYKSVHMRGRRRMDFWIVLPFF